MLSWLSAGRSDRASLIDMTERLARAYGLAPAAAALKPVRVELDPGARVAAHARLMRQVEDGRQSGAF